MRLSVPDPNQPIDLSSVDLLDPHFYAEGDPHSVWFHLRRSAPVYKHQSKNGQEFWVVTKYDDVCRILKDYNTFTSQRGSMLCILNLPDVAGGKMLAVTDPPRHTQVREPLTMALTRKVVQAMEGKLRQIVTDLLAPGLSGEPWDFAEAALLFPTAFMAGLMDLPREDWEHLARHTTMSIAYDDPDYAQESTRATLRRAHHELFDYFGFQVARRRASKPGDDLIGLLMTMDADGVKLTDEEILFDCYSLLLGASVTTPYAASATVLAMAEDPGEYHRWATHPEMLASGVEEGLRWASPTSHFMRYALQDVEMRGEVIRHGDPVTAWLGSANRDEEVFGAPYQFDVGRRPNHHIAFGFGPHSCIGAPLARAALQILFSEVLRCVERIELVGPIEHLASNFTAGIKHMPVRMIPRQKVGPAIG